MYEWSRYSEDGYECSGAGDWRFSALFAQLSDGRTIEDAYQLDVKGYRVRGNNWRLGKGKPALLPNVDLWEEYLALWKRWALENPELIEDLAELADGRPLTDQYAVSPISQARALAQILNERPSP